MTNSRSLLGAMMLMAIPFGAAASAASPSGGHRLVPDLAYIQGASATAYERERCTLDLYVPNGVDGFPTVVWFHGGGLQNGSKDGEMTRKIAQRLANDGVAVATVNYRLSPKVKFPAYIEDAARSVAWVHRSIAQHGGDPAKVLISGHSAGGYLAAMLGMDPQYLGSQGLATGEIAGLLPVSGQMITHSTVRSERGLARTTPIIDAAAPSYHVRPDAPPCLCIAGGEDMPTRAEENIYFVAALKAAGHKHADYLEVAGRTHGTIASRIPEPNDPVAKAMLAFIKKHSR